MIAKSRRPGVSAIEVVIVIIVMALLAALVVPRLSRGATAQETDPLGRELAVLRIAIEMYYDSHGAYPGQKDAGAAFGEAGTPEAFVAQLTLFTDGEGRVSTTRSAEYSHGPYLRDGVPACAVASVAHPAAVHVIDGDAFANYQPGVDAGWVFNCRTGYIAANSAMRDPKGTRYDEY